MAAPKVTDEAVEMGHESCMARSTGTCEASSSSSPNEKEEQKPTDTTTDADKEREERRSMGLEEPSEQEQQEDEVEAMPRKEVKCKVFLGGLSLEATVETVREHFEVFGELSNVRVPLHKELPGKSRGFGFVTFKDGSVARRVVEDVKVHKICGRQVDVKFSDPPNVHAQRKGSRSRALSTPRSFADSASSASVSSTSADSSFSSMADDELECAESTHGSLSARTAGSAKLFVGGLASDVNERVLLHHFSMFGPITSTVVMIDRETLRSRGFGFVTFESESSLLHALAQPQHCISGKFVEVKRAIPRGMVDQLPPPRVRTANRYQQPDMHSMGFIQPYHYPPGVTFFPAPQHWFVPYPAPVQYVQQHPTFVSAVEASSPSSSSESPSTRD